MISINLHAAGDLVHVQAQIVSTRGRPVDAGSCIVTLRYLHDDPRTYPFKGALNARFELGVSSALRGQTGSIVLSSEPQGERTNARLEWKCGDTILLSHTYRLDGDGVVVIQDEFEYV